MSIRNGYCTLTDFKNYIKPRGQSISTDTTDDASIEKLIEGSSRQIEQISGRKFYPRVETRVHSVPDKRETNDERLLMLDDDLLSLITLTNGNGTVLTASDFTYKPSNNYPKWGIRLKDSSSVIWELDSNSDSVDAIDILAFWGYHDDFANHGWKIGGTLGAAISGLTSTSVTLTAGHALQAAGGEILKIDNEIMISSAIATNALTVVARGDNGSTAALHDNGSTVYIFDVMPKINEACLEITNIAYRRRYGENIEATSRFTAGGIIVTPRDIPGAVREYLESLRPLI